MLIQFRVQNHRSLRDEQVLSLVAVDAGLDDERLLRSEGLGEALLPAVALYGANASGKTNVLLALDFMVQAVMNSHRLWEPAAGVPRDPFALSARREEASLYEVDFVLEHVRFRYGFTVNDDEVEREWLYSWPATRRKMQFERERGRYSFGRNPGGDNETIRGLTRPNSLFLSAGAQNNHPVLIRMFRWFHRLRFVLRGVQKTGIRFDGLSRRIYRQFFESPTIQQLTLFDGDVDTLEDDRQMIVQLLRAADTGIVDLRIDMEAREDYTGRSVRRPSLYFRHKTHDTSRAWLPAEAESAGTIALLELSTSLIPTLRTGGILCVDELEASLHPMLAATLVSAFCDPRQNVNGAQLVFTTHDTNLLGDILGFTPLRRDQIWLTEKDHDGATDLYPLTDFYPRKQENLERGYLQGRYGAVPFLSDAVFADTAPEQQ